MAVGKLAKLLVKMGQKDLVRNFSKAPVKTTFKTAGKALIWPAKQGIARAHMGQGLKPVTNAAGEVDLVANKFYKYGGIAAGTELVGSMVYMVAADSYEERLGGYGATLGTFGGFILGGPIGALIGGASGYFIGKSTASQPNEEIAQHEEITEANEETSETSEQPESDAPVATETDSIATDSVPTPATTALPADSVPTDSIATTPIIAPTDSVAATDSIPQATVPTVVPADSTAVEQPAVPTDSVAGQQPTQPPATPKTPEEQIAEHEEKIKELEQRVAELEGRVPAAQEPSANNIFGGEINEISLQNYTAQKGDCLWNIAKRELQKANPGKRITNAQILKQVKEFGRINPEIYGENPSLEALNKLYVGQELKLSA